ncbi:hypothetical protein BKA81DRAFT_232739 [Phyllosticta paracitricarpa]|uniref:Uncharacterized protein n=1 Tax=Phyllosticta citricarpa TaxID=55181 RepID=A0ABR1MP48_9PEZI
MHAKRTAAMQQAWPTPSRAHSASLKPQCLIIAQLLVVANDNDEKRLHKERCKHGRPSEQQQNSRRRRMACVKDGRGESEQQGERGLLVAQHTPKRPKKCRQVDGNKRAAHCTSGKASISMVTTRSRLASDGAKEPPASRKPESTQHTWFTRRECDGDKTFRRSQVNLRLVKSKQ